MYQFSQTMQTALAAQNPQRVLLEFTRKPNGTAYSPVVQFSNEDILVTNGVKLTSEFNSETDLTIGLCPSAEIQFSMLNDKGQLENFEFGTFNAYLGVQIRSGTPASSAKTKSFTEHGISRLYEFAPLGTFIAKRPDIVRVQMIDVDANDQMTLFDVEMPSKTALGITYPITLKNLCSAMCSYLGVTLGQNSWLNSNISVSKEPAQFEAATMREVLGWIAEAGCSNARFDRNGQLEFVWLNPVQMELDEHNYSEFTTAWYETKAIDGLHIRNADSTTEYVVGTGSNAYMIQDNPFLRQDDS